MRKKIKCFVLRTGGPAEQSVGTDPKVWKDDDFDLGLAVDAVTILIAIILRPDGFRSNVIDASIRLDRVSLNDSNFFVSTVVGDFLLSEIRAETQALKKSSAQFRSEIAALKRRVAALERQLKKLGKQSAKAIKANTSDEEPSDLRFRSGGFSTLRKKLGLSASDMGKLIGVSAQSVYHWEAGKTKPRASQLQAIAAVRKMGKRAAAANLA